MADLVSLATLRSRAQYAADMVNSGFVTTAEWNGYINYGARRLYDVLTSAFGDDYAIKSYSVPLVAGQDTYALPTDFFRERAVDVIVAGQNISAQRFMFKDRNKYNWANISWASIGCTPLYSIEGANIKFMPAPNITGTGVTLWYIPTLQVYVHGTGSLTSASLVNDDDTIDGVNGYEELIVLEAAIRAKLKEDTDASALISQRNEVLAWITDSARNRNAGDPAFVTDVTDRGSFFTGFNY